MAIPNRWEFPRNRRGVHPFKNLEINLQSVFHRYGDPPALIRAKFSSGDVVEITITREEIIARRTRVSSRHNHAQTGLSRVSILPQVAPVAREERLLSEDYVKSALSSALAPMHFRNQLYLFKEHFQTFKATAEQTWPGLRIRTLETAGSLPEPIMLALFVEDHYFTSEIAWMGHGLQMWLQMIWFLSRTESHETVILDEPDVYMHADLQRRLVRFVRNRHQQVIIATHSSEIMAEVLPDNILVVDRAQRKSDFASSLPAVQKVLTGLGSIHNLQLSRLWNAQRFLIVEGKDIALLKLFQNIVFPQSAIPIDTIPSSSIGGWGGWNQTVGSDMFLKNACGDGIVSYCILDSDYFSQNTIKKRYEEAKQRGVTLHIWHRKEIENYLLIPSSIQRAIAAQLPAGRKNPTLSDISAKLNEISEDLKQSIVDSVATNIQNADRKISVATANQRAREVVASRWQTLDDRLEIIPGKDALSRVSRWIQEDYKISISGLSLAHHMTLAELNEEVIEVLTSIQKCIPFPERVFDC